MEIDFIHIKGLIGLKERRDERKMLSMYVIQQLIKNEMLIIYSSEVVV